MKHISMEIKPGIISGDQEIITYYVRIEVYKKDLFDCVKEVLEL